MKAIDKIKKIKTIRLLLIPTYLTCINLIWFLKSQIFKTIIKVSLDPLHKALFFPVGHIAKELFLGKFEKEERHFIQNFLTTNSNVLNVGANIGLYTIISGVICKNGNVFAFEPSQMNFKRLENNVLLNNLNNIHTYNLAAGEKNSVMKLFRDNLNPKLDSHFTLSNEGKTDSEIIGNVSVVALDTLLQEFPPFDLIIIDVEGHELDLIKGARTLIKINKKSLIMMEVTKHNNEILELMKELGFKPYVLQNKSTLILSNSTHGNLFFKHI